MHGNYWPYNPEFYRIPPFLKGLLQKTKKKAIDLEGASIATETVMQGSFKVSLEENGIGPDQYGDIYDIEEETSGNTLNSIFENFKKKYNLAPSVEDLLTRRREIYVEMVERYDLTLFPFLPPIVEYSKVKCGSENFILSNGDHRVIEDITIKDGLYPQYLDHIYASESPERLKYEEEHGLKHGNKGEFLAQYAVETLTLPKEITLIEDNPKHIRNIQKEVHAAWVDLLERKKPVVPNLSEEGLGVVQEIGSFAELVGEFW
ncbi:MAG: hypothetical protein PHW76_09965 [Alphaproteobacteria bacterium]|nr:hypothetical protein [Alphaproteobacteria bacterium]